MQLLNWALTKYALTKAAADAHKAGDKDLAELFIFVGSELQKDLDAMCVKRCPACGTRFDAISDDAWEEEDDEDT